MRFSSLSFWLVMGTATLASADSSHAATIPNDCSSGQLLVSQGNNTFACVSPSRALALYGCNEGDFITMKSGELRCQGITSSTWNVKALLPSCSSGEFLQSEGFGSWRCVSAPTSLPSCSSGETIVMDGGWRCTALKK